MNQHPDSTQDSTPGPASPPLIRRSRTLLLSFDDHGLTAFDFMRRKFAYINSPSLDILAYTSSWIELPSVVTLLQPYHCPYCVSAEIARLMDAGFILRYDTPEAQKDDAYRRTWLWGDVAGYYHFGIKDPYYMTPEETHWTLMSYVATKPLVPLYATNEGYPEVVPLPDVRLDRDGLATMHARRSYRGFDAGSSLTLDQLGECLFCGLGITGFVETPMQELGLLPFKMTPSAGGRNPYEAYVYARAVAGLKAGVYHYSAVDHTLGLVTEQDLPTVGDLLGVQPWFDNAGALILLVAHFERTMWKYPHPTGFRVVLLEAGHIAQNMLLTATANGLASAPTSAISDSLAEGLLRLDPVSQSVLYTVAIGVKSPVRTNADVQTDIRPNPQLRVVDPTR